MKRYRVKNAKRFVGFLTVLLLIISFSAGTILGIFDASSKDAMSFTTVQVQSGDTLWQLARTYGPTDKDVRETIYQICKINDVTAENLQVGQYISIPN